MIDVVFLLIIFFMVGSRFTEMERQYEIDLPTVTDAAPLTNPPDEITVNVREDGGLIVQGKLLTLDQLESDLKAAKQNFPDQVVVIRGEGDGRYQHVMNVLNVCQRAQISAVSLAGQLKSEAAE